MQQLEFNQRSEDFTQEVENKNDAIRNQHIDPEVPDRIVSVGELAFYLNVSIRGVQYLADRGVFPRPEKRGEYRLIPCLHGYIDHLKRTLYRFAGSYGKAQQQRTGRLI